MTNKKMVATQASLPSFYFYSMITGNIIGTSSKSLAVCRNVSVSSHACACSCRSTRACLCSFACSSRNLSVSSLRNLSVSSLACIGSCICTRACLCSCICEYTFRTSLITCSCRSLSTRFPKTYRFCASSSFLCRPWANLKFINIECISFEYNASNSFCSFT